MGHTETVPDFAKTHRKGTSPTTRSTGKSLRWLAAISKPFQARLLRTGREPTNGLSGRDQPLTKLKPSKVQRKPIPGSTWNGCAFAKETYVRKIQPLLAGVKVRVLSSALGLSEPYAAEIHAGRKKPHPRHWKTLARLVGIAARMRSQQPIAVDQAPPFVATSDIMLWRVHQK
jgi:hypothetical protein